MEDLELKEARAKGAAQSEPRAESRGTSVEVCEEDCVHGTCTCKLTLVQGRAI